VTDIGSGQGSFVTFEPRLVHLGAETDYLTYHIWYVIYRKPSFPIIINNV